MKRNVDLTMGMDFKKQDNESINLKNIFNDHNIVSLYPFATNRINKLFEELTSEETISIDDNINNLFKVGNKSDIRQVKLYQRLEEGSNCERCGKNLFDWDNYYTLCRKCDYELEMEYENELSILG